MLHRPRGTVLSWLSWSRRRLATRLSKRGIAPVTAIATLAAAQGLPAADLVAATVNTAQCSAAGKVLTTPAAALSKEVLSTMFLNKMSWLISITILAILAGSAVLYWRRTAEPPEEKQTKMRERIHEEANRVDSELRYHLGMAEKVDKDTNTILMQSNVELLTLESKLKTIEREQGYLQSEQKFLREKLAMTDHSDSPEIASLRERGFKLRMDIDAIEKQCLDLRVEKLAIEEKIQQTKLKSQRRHDLLNVIVSELQKEQSRVRKAYIELEKPEMDFPKNLDLEMKLHQLSREMDR